MRTPPAPPFHDGVDQEDLELRGQRARALQFPEGTRDPLRAVVCIAGMGANGRSFVRQRPLSRELFLLLLNLPEETPPRIDPLEFAADAVEEYLEGERLRDVVLVGSSFGGAVAAKVALRRPQRLKALVLVSAVLSRKQIPLASPRFIDLLEAPDPLARLFAPLAAQIMGGFKLDKDARREIVREARHFSGAELKRRLLALLDLDLLPALRQLRLPTLAVHGTRDWLVPWRRGRWVAEAIAGARFVRIEGAGHLPYLSHAREFNEALGGFVLPLLGQASEPAAVP